MSNIKILLHLPIILFFAFALSACSETKLDEVPVTLTYLDEVETWHLNRVNRLKEPTGWMRLAGMFWLDEGEFTFGSDPDADIVFPKNTIAGKAGTVTRDHTHVYLNVAAGTTVIIDDKPIRRAQIFGDGLNPRVESGTLEWVVIQRGDLIGIRLYNKENPLIDAFTGFDRYPVDSKWNRVARFIPHPESTTIRIANILGQIEDANSPGIIEFYVDGVKHSLDALEGGERMFIIVGDETNKTETYQAGRFIYIDYPVDGDLTNIDFNLLYNPPCAYSEFTTCQLPPRQNILNMAVTAGENRPVTPYTAGFQAD